MKYHTTVALRGDFNPNFPDLKRVKKDDDRMPGRDLADLIFFGLKEKDLKVSSPINEEPFFVIKCCSGHFEYEITCCLFEPKNEQSVWVIEIPRKIGFLGR